MANFDNTVIEAATKLDSVVEHSQQTQTKIEDFNNAIAELKANLEEGGESLNDIK